MKSAVLCLFASAAFAQTPPAFEVASIKVDPIGKAGGEGSRRENTQVSPGSLNMHNVTLRTAIRWAYHVMDPQISGPAWLADERYDIAAKAAGPVPADEMRPMLQTLLAERFKLELHHQTKEMSAYVLTVGKNGPKFTESKSEGESVMEPDRKTFKVSVQRTPVSQLCDMLAQMFRAPVVDQTGLAGRYDITIDALKYVAEMRGSTEPPDPLTLILRGLQEELGLKLEPRKMPIELLVIDHAEKAPIEN